MSFDAPTHLRAARSRPAERLFRRGAEPHTALSSSAPSRLDLDAVLGNAAPDRLTLAATAYLLLPGLLFLAGWAEAWAGILAGAAGLVALLLAPGWRRG